MPRPSKKLKMRISDTTSVLPPDVLIIIFSHFRIDELARLQCVCKHWRYTLLSFNLFWQRYGKEDKAAEPLWPPRGGESLYADETAIMLYPQPFSYPKIQTLLRQNGHRFRELCLDFNTEDPRSLNEVQWTMHEIEEWEVRSLWIRTSSAKPYDKEQAGLDDQFYLQLRGYGLNDMTESSNPAQKVNHFRRLLVPTIGLSQTIVCLRLELREKMVVQWFEEGVSRPSFEHLQLDFEGSDGFLVQAMNADLLKKCKSIVAIKQVLFENEAWAIFDQAKDHIVLLEANISWSMHAVDLQTSIPPTIQFPQLRELRLFVPTERSELIEKTTGQHRYDYDLPIEHRQNRPQLEIPQLQYLVFNVQATPDLVKSLFVPSLESLVLTFLLPIEDEDEAYNARLQTYALVVDHFKTLVNLEILAMLTMAGSEADMMMVVMPYLHRILRYLKANPTVAVTTLRLETHGKIDCDLLLELVQSRFEGSTYTPIIELGITDSEGYVYSSESSTGPRNDQDTAMLAYREMAAFLCFFSYNGEEVKDRLQEEYVSEKMCSGDDDDSHTTQTDEGPDSDSESTQEPIASH